MQRLVKKKNENSRLKLFVKVKIIRKNLQRPTFGCGEFAGAVRSNLNYGTG